MITVIPAIDIIDGKCVRLTRGEYDSKKVYNENPADVAKRFEDTGLKRLHVVDLDGAREGHIVNYKSLERIANDTDMVIDFGGGLKHDEDLRIAFESGAQMVTGGSIAVKDPDTFAAWLTKYGAGRMILGADVKEECIAVSGWQEKTQVELIPFVRSYMSRGIRRVICTDISRDGMLQGPAVDLYRKMLKELPEITLIASGGVGSIDDLFRLEEAQVPAVIVGKAFYEGKILLKDLYRFME